MGLIELKDGLPCFAPPGPLVPHDRRIYSKQRKCQSQATLAPPPPNFKEFMDHTLLHIRMIDDTLHSMERSLCELNKKVEALIQLISQIGHSTTQPRNRWTPGESLIISLYFTLVFSLFFCHYYFVLCFCFLFIHCLFLSVHHIGDNV